jgi:hypothetical protein
MASGPTAERIGSMMEFLRRSLARFRLWRNSRRASPTAEANVQPVVVSGRLDIAEIVSRFIYSKSQYLKNPAKAKPTAFDPSPWNELSTAHVTGLSSVAIWELSKSALGDKPGHNKIYAHACVAVSVVTENELEAVRDNDPFERHTVVIGWPEIPDEVKRKERWLQIALKLSQSSNLEVATVPITRD